MDAPTELELTDWEDAAARHVAPSFHENTSTLWAIIARLCGAVRNERARVANLTEAVRDNAETHHALRGDYEPFEKCPLPDCVATRAVLEREPD